jgi:hypothetical protein
MITKMKQPFDGYEYQQEINNKIAYIRRGATTLKWIKRKMGAKAYNKITALKGFALETTLTWLREWEREIFDKVMIKGLGNFLLDYRIEKNKNSSKHTFLLLRDINYRELFGVERALDLHPCYFDQMSRDSARAKKKIRNKETHNDTRQRP